MTPQRVAGSPIRFEDIGPDGNWRRSHSFDFAGQLIQHVAGESAKGMMREWVKLRSELGEELFQELRVWSQPAAWADGVIQCWRVEVTQSINVCDCFAGQWTPRVLQVAGVAVIGPAKSAGERRKAELNQLLELKAEREGVPLRGQFGKCEIFEVARSPDGVLECLPRTQCWARLMAAVTASLGQARRAEAGRDVVVEFDESVASCEGADGAMVDGSLIVLLMLLLAAAIFGVLLGYCVRAALDPATTVARRTPQTRRTVATQSMVTYRREWATPKFTVLPEDLQGTFGEQIG